VSTKIVYDGGVYIFDENTITSCDILDSIDLVGGDMPIGVLNFSLLTEDTLYFQKGKKVRVFLNDIPIDTFYMDEAENVSLYRWNVRCVNIVDKLQNTMFDGDVYKGEYKAPDFDELSYITAGELLQEIEDISGVTIHCDPALKDKDIIGWIPYCTCRQAIIQIAFSICGVIKVLNSEIFISLLSTNVPSYFDVNRCMQGVAVKKLPVVSQVDLTSRTYIPQTNSIDPKRISIDPNQVQNIVTVEELPGWDTVDVLRPISIILE